MTMMITATMLLDLWGLGLSKISVASTLEVWILDWERITNSTGLFLQVETMFYGMSCTKVLPWILFFAISVVKLMHIILTFNPDKILQE